MDEDDKNELWLAAAQENFETALAEEDFALARDVIEDLKGKGFEPQAKVLEREWHRVQDIPYAELGEDGYIKTV